MCWLNKLFKPSGAERASPSDWVLKNSITVSNGVVTIDLNKLNVSLSKTPLVWVPEIPDTNSMDGAFDSGNNNILIAGANPDDHKKIIDFINVGDIAVYESRNPYFPLIIHRIIEIGQDGQGKYFIFKGDNNNAPDTGKVREPQIKYFSIGTIY